MIPSRPAKSGQENDAWIDGNDFHNIEKNAFYRYEKL